MQSISNKNDSHPIIWKTALPWFFGLIVASTLVLLALRSFPQIDISFSKLFFVEQVCANQVEGRRCGTFPLAGQAVWMVVRETGHALPRVLMVCVVLHLTWLLMFNPNKTRAQLYPPLAAILSALVGPLFVVNLVLKEYWGRPRPVETSFFGGQHPYVPPGDISSYCDANCSFVSGEASAAFWMLTLLFYFEGRRRTAFVVIAGLLALAIAVLRTAFGRHYLSDIIMAGCVIAVVIAFVVWLLQTRLMGNWIAALHRYSNASAFGQRKLKN